MECGKLSISAVYCPIGELKGSQVVKGNTTNGSWWMVQVLSTQESSDNLLRASDGIRKGAEL
jgi:hypothetical protein